ncbi:hypothetical protein ACJJTC_011595 [Scirpophaga incertulas]
MGSRVKPTRILCVNCSICVNKLRRRYPALAQDSIVTAIICSWVYPQIVLEEDVICEACRDLAMAAVNSSLQSEVSGSDVTGPSTRRQTNACLLCGSSILNRRSDKILRENPNEMQQSIIDLITNKLAPREISSLDRICHTCWVRSQREIIRGNLHNENRPLADITNIENQPPPAEPAPSAEHAALAEHAPPAEHAIFK